MKLLDKGLDRLYGFMSRHNYMVRPVVKADLERLHPELNQEKLCRDYYVRKIKKSLLIFAGGSLFAVLLALKAAGERQLEQDKILRRGAVTEEAQDITLKALWGGGEEEFRIQVHPLRLSEQEAEERCQDFCAQLPMLIAGNNPSIREVADNLNLQESYEGYPFTVDWRSGDVDTITSAGTVKRGAAEKEVILKADISYMDLEWQRQLSVRVLPEELTEAQRRYRDLEELLVAAEENTRTEESLILPENLGGAAIKWNRVAEDNSLALWAGALAVSVLVYVLGDRDLHEELGRQRERMRREYPDIVHKLALYIGAGMTLQGAFQKIAVEYEQRKAAGQVCSPAHEEMLYTCRELKTGVSEAKAYIHFGKRTGLQEYIRLSTLMTQNLRKGSNSLLSRLQEEADRALEARLQAGRKLSEEASTKLLVPMVLMLLVVMVMVMLPAFGTMGL